MNENEVRFFTGKEKILLPVSLLIAVLFERMVTNTFFSEVDFPIFFAAFWLSYLVILYVFYWERLKRNKVLWFVAVCTALICCWNFFIYRDTYNTDYMLVSILVIPFVLMAHAQFLAGAFPLKDVRAIAEAWLAGWFIRPFSGIPAFAGSIKSLFSFGKKMDAQKLSTIKKAVIGVCITLPLVCIILPLLAGADMAFGYYLESIIARLFTGIRLDAGIIKSIVTVLIFFTLFYSFLWNIGFGKYEYQVKNSRLQIDAIITYIVLGTVSALYILFCTVQFTYLFAKNGLPGNLTYSEYAVAGFWQTVAVCGINLFLFGVFLWYGEKTKVTKILTAGLLAFTGVMLFSGSVRLLMYIGAYGLTPLRLWSAWFVIYLIAVAAVCTARMVKEKIPAIAVCLLILLGWYVIFGYCNPEAVIEAYNGYFIGISDSLYR